MLALKDGPKHMAQIKQFIRETTGEALTADDKSMYRALRRYYDAEMVDYRAIPGDRGPDRKLYELTAVGGHVLNAFVNRNIMNVFYTPAIKKLLERDD